MKVMINGPLNDFRTKRCSFFKVFYSICTFKYLMAKVMFTDNELLMMNDEQLMPAKYQIIKKVQNYFEELYQFYRPSYEEVFQSIPTCKITKGENLNNQPYVVFDFPQIKKNMNCCHLRFIYWWGHGVYQYLYISNLTHIEQTLAFIVNECKHLDILTNASVWEYLNPSLKAINQLSLSEIKGIYEKNKLLRLDYISQFQSLNHHNLSDFFNKLYQIQKINYGINKTI